MKKNDKKTGIKEHTDDHRRDESRSDRKDRNYKNSNSEMGIKFMEKQKSQDMLLRQKLQKRKNNKSNYYKSTRRDKKERNYKLQ